MNEEIPFPITFNTYKHHLLFLYEQHKQWKNMEWKQIEKETQAIGDNLLDLYIGNLDVNNICTECLEFLNEKRIIQRKNFSNWLIPEDYRKIILSDTSEWIIKQGNDISRYIHIHPAKKSPYTFRVRANTLKTLLAILYFDNSELNKIDLQFVNYIRTRYLNISPIKSLQKDKGILRFYSLFIKHFRQHYY